MHGLAARFIAGELSFADFFPALSKLLGVFDPLDPSLEGLSPSRQAQVRFFSEWTGGEFGEFEDRIPLDPSWRYGIDTAMYSWVDVPRYRRGFASAYSSLRSGNDDNAAC
jgi:hypothetical protein